MAGVSAARTAGALPAKTTPALAVLTSLRKLRRCCFRDSFGIVGQLYPTGVTRPKPILFAAGRAGQRTLASASAPVRVPSLPTLPPLRSMTLREIRAGVVNAPALH